MKRGNVAALVAAAALLAGCSSTSSKVSAQNAGASTSPSTTASTASVNDPASASTTATKPGSGSEKPVAALLKHSKFAEASAYVKFSIPLPKAPQAWISDLSMTMSDGSPVAGPGEGPDSDSVVLNSIALVDEAAKTEDLPSLRMMCLNGCDRLATILPAKDASGRTGYERLSQLLEKTHPAWGNIDPAPDDYPGFIAKNHGTPTALDKQDMELLGVSDPKSYTGLMTSFETGGGSDPTCAWDGLVPEDYRPADN